MLIQKIIIRWIHYNAYLQLWFIIHPLMVDKFDRYSQHVCPGIQIVDNH